MKCKTVLFILQRPIKDIKANLIQTMNMCLGMSNNNMKVKLLLLNELSLFKAEQSLDSIIKDYNNHFEVELIQYKPKFRYYAELNRFIALRPYIDYEYDIIFTRSALITIYSIFKKKRVIYEAHNSYFAKQKYLNRLYELIFKRIIKNKYFTLFISISDNLNNFWVNNGILKEKALGLHDGTSLDGDDVDPEVEIPFDNNRILITYTGSLYKDRGIDRIINLSKDFQNFNFLIIGGPNEKAKEYQKECLEKNLQNICFIGRVSHNLVSSYLNKSDVLLALWSKSVPTINYCSPLKIFEYMASNKLIIADGFITIHEVLSHEKNALLCEPDDYKSLRSNLELAISNSEKYLKLGVGNRGLIKQHYSWDNRSRVIIKRLADI